MPHVRAQQAGLSLADKPKKDVSSGKNEDSLKTLEKAFKSFTDSVGRQSHYIVQGILRYLSMLPFPLPRQR